MAVAANEYGPYDFGLGASIGEAQWGRIMSSVLTDGVSPGILSELKVVQRAAGANMSVDVSSGQAFVQGHQGRWTEVNNFTVPANASGAARIDSIIARMDRANNVTELEYLTGTTIAPVLTQNETIYEIEIAWISVQNGATSIVNSQIADRRSYAGSRTGIAQMLIVNGPTVLVAIANAGYIAIPWNSPQGAVGLYNMAAPTRFTITEAGLYAIRAQVSLMPTVAIAGNGYRYIQAVAFNSAGVSQQRKTQSFGLQENYGPFPGGAVIVSTFGMSVLDPGDYVEIYVSQSSGTAMNFTGGSCTVTRIGSVDARLRFY